MTLHTPVRRSETAMDVGSVAGRIAEAQRSDGEIPWYPGGKTDPWDQVEAAMGLTVGGLFSEARRAYRWLAARQNPDGSWFSAYRHGSPTDRTRESHLAAYIAVGLFHHLRVTGDRKFLKAMWPTAVRAMDFALGLQAGGGEIYWARSPQGDIDTMALLTGSSSVYMSLKCAMAMARSLGISKPEWHHGFHRLQHAIRHRPQRFNMAKARFSMDWFYPVLCGAIRGDRAQRRVDRQWKKFVINGQGVRCVSDQPWVTLAETAELVMTLTAMGNRDQARTVFGWTADKRYENGTYWCGYTYPDLTIWPEEQYTWTNAAMLLAADALYRLTPAADLFDHQWWKRHASSTTD